MRIAGFREKSWATMFLFLFASCYLFEFNALFFSILFPSYPLLLCVFVFAYKFFSSLTFNAIRVPERDELDDPETSPSCLRQFVTLEHRLERGIDYNSIFPVSFLSRSATLPMKSHRNSRTIWKAPWILFLAELRWWWWASI